MPADPPSAHRSFRRLFVHDLVLDAAIGIYAHEHGRTQRVRINIDLAVEETGPIEEDIRRVVSYEPFVEAARALVAAGHIQLVETLAERLAERCLAHPRVAEARIRVEKLEAFPDAGSVGVEIERRR